MVENTVANYVDDSTLHANVPSSNNRLSSVASLH